MKRILAAVALAAIALPAAAVEHGRPWSQDETRAPWDQKPDHKQRDRRVPDSAERTSPEADKGAR